MSARMLKGKDFKPTLDDVTLGEVFFERGRKYVDRICQINADSDESETYSSVITRSVRLAINLQKRQISSEDVICTCSYNSLDVTIAVISTQFLGAKIANLDPKLSERHAIYLLNLVKPKIIFVDEESIELIENCVDKANLHCELVVFFHSTKYTNFEKLIQWCPNEDSFRPIKVEVHENAVLLFSSGTTGLPKAICHSNYSCLQMGEIFQQNSYDDSVLLYFSTYYWISATLVLIRTFLNGSTRVFARKMEGEKTFQIIEKYKVTATFTATLHTYQLINVPNYKKYDISQFRYMMFGGSTLSNDHQKKLIEMFPNTKILFAYGMTETGIVTLFESEVDEEFMRTKIGSAGRPGPGIVLKVVDSNTEEMLGPYQEGEIRLKGNSVMRGYYKMNSSGCFDKDGFLRSGDVGYYDNDDCIYVIGRLKEMFVYQCWHIVPALIESVLLEHPKVEESVVFGIPKEEEGEVPAACVVVKKNCQVDKKEIEKFVEERVSDREKLRGGVFFVDYIPKTPSGKHIRNEARKIATKSV